ncbi:hypothetical protein GCM10020367_53200 [Streptomyces sannanensis]|uniref:Uncharacterized protein n=1 Tax=Streptomyces sannanensis TaxID=285536 RepID=A0ABP6SIQ8_9ACTN
MTAHHHHGQRHERDQGPESDEARRAANTPGDRGLGAGGLQTAVHDATDGGNGSETASLTPAASGDRVAANNSADMVAGPFIMDERAQPDTARRLTTNE